MRKSLHFFLALANFSLFYGCGGGSSSPPTLPPPSPGAARLSVVVGASTVNAGTPLTVTVNAIDTSGATVPTYAGTVHLTSSDPQASFQPTSSTLVNGTGNFTVTFKATGTQTVTAADTAITSITGTSTSISVNGPVSAITLSLSIPSSVTAGTAFQFAVTALDPSNNVVTSYSGSLHFSSTDTHAALPPDGALTSGSGSFSATLNTVGSGTITVTDTAKPSLTATSSSIIIIGPATHFRIATPVNATVGTAFDLTLTALDSSNNMVATYNGSIHFTSTDSHAELPPNSSVSNGSATFPVGLKTLGSQTISVNNTVQPSISGTSSSINVKPAVAANAVPLLNWPLRPGAVGAGAPSFTLTVDGTGFVRDTVVHLNGAPLVTAFVNDSKLTAAVPSTDIASFNTGSVTVFNPAPGGGTSNVVYLEATLPTTSVASSMATQVDTGLSPAQLITGDFNRDGKFDIVTANFDSNNISVLLGKGDGTFEPAMEYPAGPSPVSVASSDLNGDGKLDLVVANYFNGSISVLLGNGDGTFQPARTFSIGTNPSWIVVGDLNGDGKLDVATADPSGNDVSMLLGNGDGTFLPALNFAAGFHPVSVTVGDFNQDGKLDLAVANQLGDNVGVLLGNGDGTFQPTVEFATGATSGYSAFPTSITTADFNGDGKLDLAVANRYSNNVSVFLGNGDGSFQTAVNYSSSPAPTSIVVGDFNGDGKLDLLVGSGARNSASLLLGNGDGTFQSPLNYDTGSTGFNSSRVGAGDFNDDGRLDIAVANSTGSTISVLLQPSLTPGPRALLWPTSLSFANQAVGTTSAPQTVVLTNYGLSPLHVSSKTVSNNFLETDDCGSSLAPGARCTFNVTFSPTPQGNATGTLSVTDDAPGSPQIVSLDGESTTVQLIPNSMHFICDTHRPNPCLNPQIATLTNTGSHTLVISNISIGVLNNPLTETNNCPTNLGPEQSCTITVKYHGGIGTGYLTVADNASDSPQKISLSAYEF